MKKTSYPVRDPIGPTRPWSSQQKRPPRAARSGTEALVYRLKHIGVVLNRQNPAVVDMIHTRFTRYIMVVLDLPSGFGGMNCPFASPMI